MSEDAYTVALDLSQLGGDVQKKVRTTVTLFSAKLQRAVKSHASQAKGGPVGPGVRRITGNYLGSINRKTTHRPDVSIAQVGSSAPQARRLELGFHGTDSLGRSYSQGALPHFSKGLEDVESQFAQAIADAAMPER